MLTQLVALCLKHNIYFSLWQNFLFTMGVTLDLTNGPKYLLTESKMVPDDSQMIPNGSEMVPWRDSQNVPNEFQMFLNYFKMNPKWLKFTSKFFYINNIFLTSNIFKGRFLNQTEV